MYNLHRTKAGAGEGTDVGVHVIEDEAVTEIRGARGSRDGKTVIVLSPRLSPEEKYQLLVELLED